MDNEESLRKSPFIFSSQVVLSFCDLDVCLCHMYAQGERHFSFFHSTYDTSVLSSFPILAAQIIQHSKPSIVLYLWSPRHRIGKGNLKLNKYL